MIIHSAFKHSALTTTIKQNPTVGMSGRAKVMPCLRVVSKSVSQRQAIEEFIRSQYRQHFEADLLTFFPAILTVYCQQNQKLLGALGLRYADESDLFSEQYLRTPIEQLISARTGIPVARTDIIELGHFALLKPRYLTPVITTLAGFIRQLNAQWAVYTLSTPIKNALDKLAIQTSYLASAEACQLKCDDTNWGQYYHLQPAVYYSQIETAIHSNNPMEDGIERT